MTLVRTPNLPLAATIDDLIGNRVLTGDAASTVRIRVDDLATQMMASGPLGAVIATMLGELRADYWRATRASLDAIASPPLGAVAAVFADGVLDGLWEWTGTTWVFVRPLAYDIVTASVAAAEAAAGTAVGAAGTAVAMQDAARIYADAALAASVGNAAPARVLGFVATRGNIPTLVRTDIKQAMTETRHFARDRINRIKIRYWNRAMPTGVVDAPGPITYVTAVKRRGRVVAVATYGGSPSGTGAPGTWTESDWVYFSCPDGGEFRTTTWAVGPDGLVLQQVKHSLGGDRAVVAASGLVDLTGSAGEIPDDRTTYPTFMLGPTQIIGETAKKSILFVSDSRGGSDGSSVHFNWGSDKGNLGHAFGPYFGYCQAGRTGQRLSAVLGSLAAYQDLATYATDVVIHEGINDLSVGTTGTALLGILGDVVAGFPGKRCHTGTIEPVTTGPWDTVAGQTKVAWDGERVIYNTGLGAVTGIQTVFDFAAGVEAPEAPGKWRLTTDGLPMTSDGWHLNDDGHRDVDPLAAFDPRVIGRWPDMTRVYGDWEDHQRGRGTTKVLSPGAINRFSFSGELSAAVGPIAAGASHTPLWDVVSLEGMGYYDWASGRVYLYRGRYKVSSRVLMSGITADKQYGFLRVYRNISVIDEDLRPTWSGLNLSLKVETEVDVVDGDYVKAAITISGSSVTVQPTTGRTYLKIVAI